MRRIEPWKWWVWAVLVTLFLITLAVVLRLNEIKGYFFPES